MKFLINIFFIVVILFFKVESKDYDGNSYTCADEIGPLLKFSIPKLNEEEIRNISFMLFNKVNRELFTEEKAFIEKKSSPIDRTYFYYEVNYKVKENNLNNGYFEFYPPSHLMVRISGSSFTSLVCWK